MSGAALLDSDGKIHPNWQSRQTLYRASFLAYPFLSRWPLGNGTPKFSASSGRHQDQSVWGRIWENIEQLALPLRNQHLRPGLPRARIRWICPTNFVQNLITSRGGSSTPSPPSREGDNRAKGPLQDNNKKEASNLFTNILNNYIYCFTYIYIVCIFIIYFIVSKL